MKKIFFPFLIINALLFSSCTKVINIDLNSKDPQIVIEGNISDQPGPYTISITQSVNFSQSNSFPAVTGASVTVSDNLGNSEVLTEVSPGIYHTTTTQGVSGRTYYMTVVTNNKTYLAQSTIPTLVTLDTLILEPNNSIGPPFYIIPFFLDPVGSGNYYRCIETIDHVRVKGSFLYDDQFNDGLVNGQPILNFSDSLNPGDTVIVELQCVDKASYMYFFSLDQTISGQSGAPANPVSNISNSALGYFSAHTSRKKITVIP
ncbi:MAG: DUF4249 domain-containing protein [Bacteroidetes bacterium]|nr:DUF4249 domain-containing protein [Bacteroidota bacterium]